MGVTLEGLLPSKEALAEGVVASPPTAGRGEAAAWSVISPASCFPRARAGTGRGEEVESEDKTMGASGKSPAAGRGVMRDGWCGSGAAMPSDEVSIGEELADCEVGRASWKAGPCVTMGGMPLAGRANWMASQKASETTVREGEAPCDWATAVSISTIVSLTVAVGMWARAASTAASCSWDRVGGMPARREAPKGFRVERMTPSARWVGREF
jgi:hypothetical protein